MQSINNKRPNCFTNMYLVFVSISGKSKHFHLYAKVPFQVMTISSHLLQWLCNFSLIVFFLGGNLLAYFIHNFGGRGEGGNKIIIIIVELGQVFLSSCVHNPLKPHTFLFFIGENIQDIDLGVKELI